jgi:multidrug efflux pump subunit AcrB
MSSVRRQGTSVITIQFDLNHNIDAAAMTSRTARRSRSANRDRNDDPAELPGG